MVSLKNLAVLASSLLPLLTNAAAVPTKDALNLQVYQKRYYDYDNQDVIRGVNIGGWLVLEPYITPSIFEAFRTNDYNDDGIPVDEYHLCQQLGTDAAKDVLTQHWDSFYTEDDFAKIADMGFNLVRIPIGYWAFNTLNDDPYVTGLQESYLDKAIQWSANHGLKVWVDLHGAAGSQNGFDNSGLRDSINFPQDDNNLQLTLKTIKYLLNKYSAEEYINTVIGIELINEPLGPSMDLNKLKYDYLKPAYDYLRNEIGNTDQIVVIHDAFVSNDNWDTFLTNEDSYGVVIDHHHYQVFSPGELQRSIEDHIAVACDWANGHLSDAHWNVAGEFSAALTDCNKWLNGVGIGARFDGSFNKGDQTSYYIGSCADNENIDTWSEERKTNTRRYVEAQLDSFEERGGWIIWCYKTETSIEWGVDKLAANGLFPQPISDRQYPGQCGNVHEQASSETTTTSTPQDTVDFSGVDVSGVDFTKIDYN